MINTTLHSNIINKQKIKNMDNNTQPGWEPEEERQRAMTAFDEQPTDNEDDTTLDEVEPNPEDDDIEEGSLEDDDVEEGSLEDEEMEDLDETDTGHVTEELKEDESNDEVDNLDSEYKTSPQGEV